MAITYTPFDLPRTITQGPDTITLGYDGEQKRIRKTTPAEEILYFEGLYERVTEMGSAATADRYYIYSPERAVAVVTRGGATPGTKYLHVDHLGSVNAVTKENGAVDERRSYDAYGQRRNPEWGQPPPPAWNSKTTKDFTGHESDEELGLVNMKGRIFDPKLGRFMTTDPVVADLYSGQSFNAYSYVHGNPLTFIDPTGFREDPTDSVDFGPSYWSEFILVNKGPDDADDEEPDDEASSEEFGACVPPTDVDTTGSSAGPDVQGSPPDKNWHENKYLQTEGGFIGGLGLGIVPYGAIGRQALEDARVMAPGTRDFSVGRSVGEMTGGLLCLMGGLGGEFVGTGLSVTAAGAAVGVPAIVVSTGLVMGGAANIEAGYQGLLQALKSPGSGGSGSSATPSSGGGSPKSSSSALGRNMERAGQTRPPGTAAHHMVAGKADGAKVSQAILQKFGVGINDAENGVFLPMKTHYHIHTNAYYQAVEDELRLATTREEVIDVLAKIRYALMNGGFP
jgi:RHS repeat-associated protein